MFFQVCFLFDPTCLDRLSRPPFDLGVRSQRVCCMCVCVCYCILDSVLLSCHRLQPCGVCFLNFRVTQQDEISQGSSHCQSPSVSLSVYRFPLHFHQGFFLFPPHSHTHTHTNVNTPVFPVSDSASLVLVTEGARCVQYALFLRAPTCAAFVDSIRVIIRTRAHDVNA